MTDFLREIKKDKNTAKLSKFKGIYNFQVRIISAENTSFRWKNRIETFLEMQVISIFTFWKEAMECLQIKEIIHEQI